MHRMSLLLCAALVAGLAASAAGQGESKKEIKAEKAWTGRIVGKEKEDLMKLAPANGYVAGPMTFAKVWKSWRSEEKVPEIDFSQKLVLVSTAGGPNMVTLTPYLDEQGNLTVKSLSTLVGGPGFGYALVVVDRAGIKTVKGKPIEKEE